jgi:putative transposase
VGSRHYVHPYAERWLVLFGFRSRFAYKENCWIFILAIYDDRTCLQALANAINVQKQKEGLILHTDLGTQYTSEGFEQAMKEAQYVHSFSRKGCPYDNACIESFHAILKKEEVYRTVYPDFETARLVLFQYIEAWYNRKRIHGAIDYMTPQQLEDLCRMQAS